MEKFKALEDRMDNELELPRVVKRATSMKNTQSVSISEYLNKVNKNHSGKLMR